MDVSFIQDLNEMSPSRGQIALQFGKLMEILWSDDYKSFAPYVLKELMGKQYAIFQVELVNNELWKVGHFESRILHISPMLFLFFGDRFGDRFDDKKELKLHLFG